MSEGRTPSEPSGTWRFPTAQEVNLIQHENMQLKRRVADLERLLVKERAHKLGVTQPKHEADEPTDEAMEAFDMAHMQALTEAKKKAGIDW